MLCLTLNGRTMAQNRTILNENAQYVQVLELRLDTLDISDQSQLDEATAFPSTVDKPVILTFRRKDDGGLADVTERKRLAVLARVFQGGFSYIDIEADVRKPSLETDARSRGIQVIRSMHFMGSFPDNLALKATRIASKGNVPKIAVRISGMKDLTKLFKLSGQLSHIKDKILIGMGEYGLPSRILYRKLNSCMTFCSAEDPSGVGLPSPKTMAELYRAHEIDNSTRVYGVVGKPVGHSTSPSIHNPGFHELGYNAVYVPFNVDDVRPFFAFADMIGIRGFSVTVPHKMAVIPYLARIPREVKQLGACNTVVREHGSWIGSNTDYYGFLSLVSEPLGSGRIQSAIVIGAGGAARAVVWALRNKGVSVTILNRTVENARRLALETGSSFASIEDADAYTGTAQLIVQASSAGMDEPNVDAAPSLEFDGDEIVCDMVYRPHETAFLKRAANAGCKLIHGIDMLLAQGKLQFKAFTGFDYPIEDFVVLRAHSTFKLVSTPSGSFN